METSKEKNKEKFMRLAKIFLILDEEDEKNGKITPTRSVSLQKQENKRVSNSNC
ncbi:hypothetical protein X275_01165 [Marinitoga sp. 1197]|uniref:Uncharacterized protein n=1 Tax=Marinitoga hydrogenitolerans (strain DSM 16785 / JCM 12826 / AT1271) TaxID=1122195 RepID=A0A1M4TSA7_MARH1|nr:MULTISPECIES: hypothetical protein [Marinitoga]AJW76959.1 hypothetical protein UF08_70 [Marinitoga camini virus 1]AMS33985.1 hypothetical protein UF09_69 [Marinitoga camini virus 2]KLO24034.1 hypothetical protein X275_01165 [Marinitoga sp. 1197]KLO24794.1 hypothetical protein X274_02245 [Marinitoga sp. 1155]SHE47187.1 hypothetical protein SAMN02745164_00488 [Marinitoga hydrogenitolerans DSM 16785]